MALQGDTRQENVRDRIQDIINRNDFKRADFFEVGRFNWAQIISKMLAEFTIIRNEREAQEPHWAWERLKDPYLALSFKDGDAYTYLKFLAPQEKMWFLVEGDRQYWLYEGELGPVERVLRETWYGEYYLISKRYKWLLAENHHGVLFGLGSPVLAAMRNLALKRPEILAALK